MKVLKIKKKVTTKRYKAMEIPAVIKITVNDREPLTIEQEEKIKNFFETL